MIQPPEHLPPPAAACDCVVVGAGPAGISAAQWLASLGVNFRWFGRDAEFGGMLQRVHNAITNYPGGVYANGNALIAALRYAIKAGGHRAPEPGEVMEICRLQNGADATWRLTLDRGAPLFTRAVILASGTRYRRLGVPGEEEGLGHYVSQSASADRNRVFDQPVAVVGGGDAAFEGALILAENAARVTILMRSVRPRARRSFRERVLATPNIFIHPVPTRVQRVDPAPIGCRLTLDVQGRPETLNIARLFVRIGVVPTLPRITTHDASALACQDGFVRVDTAQHTNLAGIFAAGDITHLRLRSVAAAVGQGAQAARTVADWLEAPARQAHDGAPPPE